MFCPQCGAEFRAGYIECNTCLVPLINGPPLKLEELSKHQSKSFAAKIINHLKTRSRYSRQKQNIVIGALIFYAVTGILAAATTEGSLSTLGIGLAFWVVPIFLILVWCYYDALERGKQVTTLFRTSVVLFGIFALWVYLVRTRGIKEGLISVFVTVLLNLGMILVVVISGLAVDILISAV